MVIDYSIFTNQGDRENNEDYTLVREKTNRYCFIVNDGLGGCGNGEVASQTAAVSIGNFFDKGIKDDFFKSSFICARENIEKKQNEVNSTDVMKTTSVVLTIDSGVAQWGHIGDSRLYYFKGSRLKTRTLDHSVPQMLVSMKEIKEQDIRFHKDRNRLLKAIGNRDPQLMPSVSKKYRISSGASFLLCTDGFWELITEEEMISALKITQNAAEWIEKMSTLVLKKGLGNDMDNASAIGVRVL